MWLTEPNMIEPIFVVSVIFPEIVIESSIETGRGSMREPARAPRPGNSIGPVVGFKTFTVVIKTQNN